MRSTKTGTRRRDYRVIAFLGLITVLKAFVFAGPGAALGLQPFVGANAQQHYLPTAHRLVEEGRFNGPDSRPDSKVPPGYSMVMAAAMKVLPGHFLLATVLVQFGADLVTALTVFWLSAQLTNRTAAVVAAGVWILFPPAVAISTWITSETLFIALLTTSTTLFWYALQSRSRAASCAAGLLNGLATYFRGTSLLLPLVYAPVLCLQRRYKDAALFALATFCAVAPWTIRNYQVLGDPILMSVGAGGVFLQGSDSRYFRGDGKAAAYPTMFQQAAADGRPKPATDHESAIDGWLGAVGRRNYELRWKNDPQSFVSFFVYKFFRLWYGTEAAGWKSQVILAGCSMLLMPLGAWQWWRWRKVRPLQTAVIASQMGYFVALHIVTLPEIRYMLPLFPLFAIGAAAFVTERVAARWSERWQSDVAKPPGFARSGASGPTPSS